MQICFLLQIGITEGISFSELERERKISLGTLRDRVFSSLASCCVEASGNNLLLVAFATY